MLASFNQFIADLSKADQISLLKGSRKIYLNTGDILSSPTQQTTKIYFPISGSIALFIGNQDKLKKTHGLAVGLVGCEGAAGLQLAFGFAESPFQLLVQSPGEAYVVEAAVAQQLVKRRLQVLLKVSKYLWTVYEGIASFAAKAYTKDVKSRLAHWLLLSANRCKPDPLQLTHAHMAKMLGVRRSSISIAAREIKLKRYIHYTRGSISLTNVPALEDLSNS